MQIGFLNLYGGVLNVRQERASLIADNIANADTPGYKATDVSFQQALAAQLGDSSSSSAPLYRTDGTVALDGNDVDLDGERVEASRERRPDGSGGDFPASGDIGSDHRFAPEPERELTDGRYFLHRRQLARRAERAHGRDRLEPRQR